MPKYRKKRNELRLIVNADDFGLSKGVNYGILECFRNGVLTSTTMMMNAPALDHAIELMKQYDLAVGIHLVASMFEPLTTVKSFTKEDGLFDKGKMFDDSQTIDEMELEKEWRAQIDLFVEKTGKKPTHIDSHHHVHKLAKTKKVIMALANEYGLQIRGIDTPFGEPIQFISDFYGENIGVKDFKEIVKGEGTLELMCHPAFIDNGLLNATSYNSKRKDELDTLTSKEIRSWVENQSIELISYQNTKI